jgi:lipopolysaccharide export system protein LptC
MKTLFHALLDLWSRVLLFLPLLLVAVLALSTYWLYRHTPTQAAAEPQKPLRHEADYFMRNFSIRSFDASGQLKSEVRGDMLRHYPDTDTLEIEKVVMQGINQRQNVTLASGHRAISNADGSEVQLLGNARVLRDETRADNGQLLPRLAFEGEFLHIFANTEQIKSHKPVTVIRGTDRIEASSLDFSYLDRNATFSGRVSARFDGR